MWYIIKKGRPERPNFIFPFKFKAKKRLLIIANNEELKTMNLLSSIHDPYKDASVRTLHQSDIERSPERNPLDPFNVIDSDDVLVSDRPEIQELNEYAINLDERIPDNFDPGYIEFEFAANRLAYVRNGLLLAKLKFLKLYKEFGDGTFASFCRERLQITRWQVNDTIKAARVTMELIYAGFEILPTNISQAIALASLRGEELVESWRKVVTSINPDKITHKSIRSLLFPPTESDLPPATIKVSPTLHEDIHREAADRGMSIADLVKVMFDFFIYGSKDRGKSDNSHLFERVAMGQRHEPHVTSRTAQSASLSRK